MKRIMLIIPLIIASILLSGCLGVDHNFREIRNDIISSTGDNYQKDVEFSIGSVGLSLAGAFIKHSNDSDKTASEIIRHISHIQIGVYKHKKVKGSSARLLNDIDGKLINHGWTYIIKTCDNGDLTSIYIQKNSKDVLKKMFVINLDRDELVMLQLEGNLNKIIDAVIRERGVGMEYASIN